MWRPSVVGQMHVNHLDRAELVDDRTGRESCGDVVCLVARRDLKAVCEEADEDVRFDAIVALMPDGRNSAMHQPRTASLSILFRCS